MVRFITALCSVITPVYAMEIQPERSEQPQRTQPQQQSQQQPENRRSQNAQQRQQPQQQQANNQGWYDPSMFYNDSYRGVQNGQQVPSEMDRQQQTVAPGNRDRTALNEPRNPDLNRGDPNANRQSDNTQQDRNIRGQRNQSRTAQQGQGQVTYAGQSYDRKWWNSADQTMSRDGYYDGYYDGYEDDEFGYDHYNSNGAEGNRIRYGDGYSQGYYDGYYDKQRGYESDWTYYLNDQPVNPDIAERQGRERMGDERRVRGDRAGLFGSSDLRSESMESAAAANRRYRGTVTHIEPVASEQVDQSLQGQTLQQITLDNGDAFVANLGPLTDQNLIAEGDRLSVVGQESRFGQREVLGANRIRINDRMLWNSQSNAQPTPIAGSNPQQRQR